eukprot:1146865-Pelagomonas_calceolata.AAC.8
MLHSYYKSCQGTEKRDWTQDRHTLLGASAAHLARVHALPRLVLRVTHPITPSHTAQMYISTH